MEDISKKEAFADTRGKTGGEIVCGTSVGQRV